MDLLATGPHLYPCVKPYSYTLHPHKMIPTMVDHALLREHAYENSKDLSEVLDPSTFSNNAGFQSIRDHGLGYFNYYLALDEDVYGFSRLDMARAHIYDHFNVYLVLFLVLLLGWIAAVIAELGLLQSAFRKRRWSKFGDSGVEYHHVKV